MTSCEDDKIRGKRNELEVEKKFSKCSAASGIVLEAVQAGNINLKKQKSF